MPTADPRRPRPAANPFKGKLPTLDTERLRLRHPRADDLDDLFAIFGDPEAMRYWSHEPLADLEAAQRYLQGIHDGFAQKSLFQWAIAERDTDRLVGTVTLYQWDRIHRRAEIGFMLAPSRWGKGYASEAVRAVLGFAFEKMDLWRVEADVEPANDASCRLLQRLGFEREGLLRERWFTYGRWTDSVIFGLLRSDYAASRET